MLENLLTDVRSYLVAQGLVRIPASAGSLPPIWLDPREGTPAPNEGQVAIERGDPVVGAFLPAGIPARPFESSLREDIVEFRIRASTGPKAIQLGRQLRDALIDRRQVQMGGQTVIDCEEWRSLTRLGSSEQGFDYLFSVRLQQYAA